MKSKDALVKEIENKARLEHEKALFTVCEMQSGDVKIIVERCFVNQWNLVELAMGYIISLSS